jgi:RNA polymerase sigma-70 factor (ECF subfamily)
MPDEIATSSEELAVRARAGSRGSFDELVVRHRPRLVAFLTRRVANSAEVEDLAQETFLRAFDHLDRYDPSRPFLTWLFAIGKNVAINHGVAQSRREARHERGGAMEIAVEAGEAGDLWPRAAAVLSPAAYQILWLRYAKGLTVREIATQLARSSVAIKVTLFRARRRLLQEVR